MVDACVQVDVNIRKPLLDVLYVTIAFPTLSHYLQLALMVLTRAEMNVLNANE